MVIALMLAASLALADGDYDRCMAPAQTNQDFSACGAQWLARRDTELNRVWKLAVADADAPTKAALLAEQRLWLAYRDKSCGYWTTGAFGREGQSVHFYTCRAGVIDARIAYLSKIGDTGAEE